MSCTCRRRPRYRTTSSRASPKPSRTSQLPDIRSSSRRPGRPLPPRARARPRRHGHGLPRPRPQARSPGRAQGPAARAGRRPRRRALPARDPDRRPAAAPAHPRRARLGRGRRPALVHHALRRGREPPRPARARGAAPGRGRPPDHARGGPARWTTPTGTASSTATSSPRTSCSQRRPRARGGLRDRARGRRGGGRAADRDRARARHAGLHEPGAGGGRARAGRAHRRLPPRLRAVRDAGRRAAVHRAHAAGHHRQAARPSRCRRARPCADVPPAVERAVARALAKVPADRFATAGEFSAALHGGIGTGPSRIGGRTRRPTTGGPRRSLALLARGSWLRARGHTAPEPAAAHPRLSGHSAGRGQRPIPPRCCRSPT